MIETERLRLRPITIMDTDVISNWAQECYEGEATRRDIIRWINIGATKDSYNLGIELKQTSSLIGAIALVRRADNYWELGYSLIPKYFGHGFATESALKLLDIAHKEKGITKFKAECAVDNKASENVIKKCGMKFNKHSSFIKIGTTTEFQSNIYTLEI